MKNEGSNGQRRAADPRLVRTAAALDLLCGLLLFFIQKLFIDTSKFLPVYHQVLFRLFKGHLVGVESGIQREDVLKEEIPRTGKAEIYGNPFLSSSSFE